MKYPTYEHRAKVSAIAGELRSTGLWENWSDESLDKLAAVCLKIGCEVQPFLRMIVQMGVDALAETHPRTLVYMSSLCGGDPELDMSGDDLPF